MKMQSLNSNRDKPRDQKYRDRAMERRVLHNQPEHPTEDDTLHMRSTDSPTVRRSSTPKEPEVKTDSDSVGNRLLKRMGWTEGSGLGSNGDGIVDPV